MECDCKDEECNNKAKYECPECGMKYCIPCASNCDYECSCLEPPRLEKIKSSKPRSLKKSQHTNKSSRKGGSKKR